MTLLRPFIMGTNSSPRKCPRSSRHQGQLREHNSIHTARALTIKVIIGGIMGLTLLEME
jgi:hypothetical protein